MTIWLFALIVAPYPMAVDFVYTPPVTPVLEPKNVDVLESYPPIPALYPTAVL
jgi:hypothetical protein